MPEEFSFAVNIMQLIVTTRRMIIFHDVCGLGLLNLVILQMFRKHVGVRKASWIKIEVRI